MNNKEIILKVTDAFDKSDINTLQDYLADDMEWHMLGDKIYKGKEAMKNFFADNPEIKVLASTKDHIIIDGDTVAVDGNAQCTGKNGDVFDMYYCDVYELEKGKIKKMISYSVNRKKQA